ncbi:MAG TPA: phospholipid carrier-dependent glycosyltransferase [Acidobacteriota bacterium]
MAKRKLQNESLHERRREKPPARRPADRKTVARAGPAPMPAPAPWVIQLLAVVLLAVFAGLSFWEMSGDAVTSDERVHLPAGYAYWKAREFRLNPEHPPLVKLLCAAPLLSMKLSMPSVQPDQEHPDFNSYQQVFGSKFLFTQDADGILFRGRIPVLVLGLVLAFLVFWWSWKLYGHPGAGLLSLFLIALEPTMIAHSHYVTTDVALACFVVGAMFFLWQFTLGGRFSMLVLAVTSMGLALASKFSAVFVLPVFFWQMLRHWPKSGLDWGGRWLGSRANARWIAAGAALLSMTLVIQVSYLFSTDIFLYLRGAAAVNANHAPNYLTYVQGHFFRGGTWWYPFYAFALKTPLPTLIIIGIGAFLNFRDRRRPALSFVLLPAAFVTLAVCAFADNLGVRYLIPATALLLVMAGRAFSLLAGRTGRLLGGILAVWLLASVLRISPHYIAYFNELAGGAENGPYYLDDSNIDWGQDFKRMTHYLKQNHINDVVLSPWGPFPPEYYGDRDGIRFKPWKRSMAVSPTPPDGVYVISVNNLVGLKRMVLSGEDPNVDWLERFRPSHRVGYSIYIYRFP